MGFLLPASLALLAAVGLDVRLEEARGLADADRAAVIEQVRARAAARGASGVITMRALALPGRIRLTLSRPDVASAVVARAELSGASWTAAIDQALDALGLAPAAAAAPDPTPAIDAPPAAAAPDPLTTTAPPPASASAGPSILGLSLLGGAVAAGATGLVLGAMNASAREEGNPLPAGPDRDALDDRATATGIGANVAFGVAAGALAAGVVVLLLDD